MKRLMLIDGNAVGYTNHHTPILQNGDLQTQAIIGSLKTIRQLVSLYPNFEVIVLWDGKSQWRFDLHPAYKSNRENDPVKLASKKEYVKQRPYIQEGLKLLGVSQLTVMTHEADDMAGLLTKQAVSKGKQVLLITKDMDWAQLVQTGVMWRNIENPPKLITAENFERLTGCKDGQMFLEYKALQGDTSDVIPGVGGLGEKRALEFLEEFGNVAEFQRQFDSGVKFKSKVMNRFGAPEGRAAFDRNMKLMNLIDAQPFNKADARVVKGPTNRDGFIDFCAELNFRSLLDDVNGFLEPFVQ